MIYSVLTFILLFTISIIAAIISKININHINIFHNLWIYNIRTNIYIIYILDEYIKNRNTGPGDYVAVDKKSIKIDSYKTSIITINTPNDLNTITLANTAYCFTFLINITSTKHF